MYILYKEKKINYFFHLTNFMENTQQQTDRLANFNKSNMKFTKLSKINNNSMIVLRMIHDFNER